MDRTNSEHVLARLKQAGIWSKKHLGQHFLVDGQVLAEIVATAKVQKEDVVVEVGPGLGVLSQKLLEEAGRVVSFEVDPEMVKILRQDFPELEVVEGDVLRKAEELVKELPTYKVVANIPYQITTPLIKLFLEGGVGNPPSSLTLLMQKEVGERLAAGPGQPGRGYLSVLCQYFGRVCYVRSVPAVAFWPVPKVDSAILHISVIPAGERQLKTAQEPQFLRFVRMAFLHPRKQLKNVLAGIWGVSHGEVAEHFVRLNIPSSSRAEELSLDQWVSLFLHPFVTK